MIEQEVEVQVEPKGFEEVAKEFVQLRPKEQMVKKPNKMGKKITIGLPKESSEDERRITLSPSAVDILCNNGLEVLVEEDAGLKAQYSNRAYANAGAKIEKSREKIWETDIILKITPPSVDEIALMKTGRTLISALNLNTLGKPFLKAINGKRLTCIAFEFIEDKVGGLPIVRAMSEIAGSAVMNIAAENLNSINNGQGIILGGITGVPPAKAVILGAGTVAEYAARAAVGLGVELKIFDYQIYKLRRLKELLGFHHISTSTIDTQLLESALRSADVAIGAMRSSKSRGRSPMVVSEDMVMQMKPNSVIIDVSIDHGGCFETSRPTTHSNPVYRRHDVIHYCVPNLPSRVASTASTALSHIFTPILLKIEELGGCMDMMYNYKWFTKGIYSFNGFITNPYIAEKHNMQCKDVGLILAAQM
jgi:alanine dehydrogenase